jgi:hypothetical protein
MMDINFDPGREILLRMKIPDSLQGCADDDSYGDQLVRGFPADFGVVAHRHAAVDEENPATVWYIHVLPRGAQTWEDWNRAKDIAVKKLGGELCGGEP